jgi:ubiquinone/menaquinone biosynthesis C-methylase UbiE
MNELDIIVDFYKDTIRQGPGDDKETIKALGFISNLNEQSKVIDIGCGTGSQTIALAQNTTGKITAVDFSPELLDKLNIRIKENNLADRVKPELASMFDLQYPDNEFDLIWAEGSIYIIGFSKGLEEWRRILKTNGYIAVTEISWLTENRPTEIEKYWNENYSEIDTISNKVEIIKKNGYTPITSFVLPEYGWTDNYYEPIANRLEEFAKKHAGKKDVIEFIENAKLEYEMYKKYKEYYSYVFYIAQKTD